MKLRNFLIVLFAVLLVFAFASCKHEPKAPENTPKPIPTDDTIYKFTATVARNSSWYGADKFRINLENGGVVVKEGSTLYFKFRATTEFYEFNLRSSIEDSLKWVYEQDKTKFESFSEPDADGWITVTYTFGDSLYNGNDASELYGEKTGFFLDFIGDIIVGDVLEIKNMVVDGVLVPITAQMVVDKYVRPTFEANAAADWADDGKYVVYFLLGDADGNSAYRTPAQEIVNAGQTITTDLEHVGENLVIYNLGPESGFRHFDYDNPPAEAIFEKTTPITYNTKLLLVYTPKVYNVTFDKGEATSDAIPAQSIQHGQKATEPAVPVKGTDVFAGWFVEGATTAFDFNTPITADTVLQAKFGAPINVTFNAENGEAEHEVKQAANGYPIAPIAEPTYGSKIFDGWFLEGAETAYDFSTPVTAAIELHAHWINATKVTLVNYDRKQTKQISVELDTPMEAPEVEKELGFNFGGWFDDAACENAHNFTPDVTDAFTLYAKWTPAKIVTLTSTLYTSADGNSHDKFELVWENKALAGQVLSITFRTTEPFTQYSLRGAKKWIYEANSSKSYPAYWQTVTTSGEWTTVTYTFPEAGASGTAETIPDYGTGATFKVHFRNQKMVPGAILEILSATLDGEDLPIEEANVGSYGAPTLTKDVDCYDWTSHTVTFDTDGIVAVAPAMVDFGKKVAQPDDPEKEGYVFGGWYADEELTKEFDFGVAITKDTVIYAKLGEEKTVTFEVNGGSEVAAKKVPAGDAVAKPADPTKADNVFGGWYTDDETFLVAYDFATPVTENIKLYAKWIPSVKLTYSLNYDGAPAATVADVEAGGAITAPKNPSRAGWFFGGWYKEAGCTNAFDFAEGITESGTVYAKWVSPTKYYTYTVSEMTEGVHNDRIQFTLTSSSFASLTDLSVGDTITFMMKSSATLGKIRVRNITKPRDVDQWYTLGEAIGDWIPVTITLNKSKTAGGGLYIAIYRSGEGYNTSDPYDAFVKDDTVEIKALAFNGEEIVLTSSCVSDGYSSSDNFYYGVPATFAENTL